MKKIVSYALILCMLLAMALSVGCSANNANNPAGDAKAAGGSEPAKNNGLKEEYVWCCQYNSLPLFVNNDYIGMDLIAEQLGVIVRKSGPQKVDLPAFIASIEQEIIKKPDGMMVVGWDPSEKVAIDKAIDAGIPVITVDADVPASKRLAFVGTDWYDLGVEQAKAVATAVGDKKGKAVMIGLPSAPNTFRGRDGYTATLKELCPNVEVVQEIYDSQSNPAKVAETVANLIASTPDLIAIGGFDSSGGPGIATALKEANKVGQIFATCVDAEAEHLQAVKEGSLVAAIGQKRHFFTYYGVRLLYDYNHNNIAFTKDDKKLGISPIPTRISTGFIVATKDNVDTLIESAAEKAK